jgi:hypothetical protein
MEVAFGSLPAPAPIQEKKPKGGIIGGQILTPGVYTFVRHQYQLEHFVRGGVDDVFIKTTYPYSRSSEYAGDPVGMPTKNYLLAGRHYRIYRRKCVNA